MPVWKTQKLRNLAKALLSLRTEAEMLAYLRDVATLEELHEMANRWEVVQELDRGKQYRDIAKRIGMSTATITRIAHWLHHGEGGYKRALTRKNNRS